MPERVKVRVTDGVPVGDGVGVVENAGHQWNSAAELAIKTPWLHERCTAIKPVGSSIPHVAESPLSLPPPSKSVSRYWQRMSKLVS